MTTMRVYENFRLSDPGGIRRALREAAVTSFYNCRYCKVNFIIQMQAQCRHCF